MAQNKLPSQPKNIDKNISNFQVATRYQAGIITHSDGTGKILDSIAISVNIQEYPQSQRIFKKEFIISCKLKKVKFKIINLII